MVWRPQWKLLPKLTCFFIRQNSDSRPSPHGINLHLNERAYRIRLYMNIDESKWINFYTKNVKLAKLNYESFLFDGSSVVWSSFWGGFFSTIFFAVLVRNPTIRFFHTFLIFWFWESCDVEWSGVGMLSKSEYNAHMGPETRISANRIEQFVRAFVWACDAVWSDVKVWNEKWKAKLCASVGRRSINIYEFPFHILFLFNGINFSWRFALFCRPANSVERWVDDTCFTYKPFTYYKLHYGRWGTCGRRNLCKTHTNHRNTWRRPEKEKKVLLLN